MKNKSFPESIVYLAIGVIAALLFIPFLGGVHLFDWDEINFAESAREMIVSGDYLTVQINYVPFWEKPPLFIWMQVASMKIFGINEFAARFPNAICGIVTLLVLYSVGVRIYDRVFGLCWILTYAGSLLPFLYFKSGIIDPWFNLFIFMGIYRIYLYFNLDTGRSVNISLAALFIGLAILTKGPVALLVVLLVMPVYAILKKFRLRIPVTDVLLFSILLILTGGFWFLLQIIMGNFSVIHEFITYQIHLFRSRGAGHGGFPLYHVVVLLTGVFPASILAIPAFFRRSAGTIPQVSFMVFMKILFWVVLILFSIVKTKIVHYSSLCYFPLTCLAAYTCYQVYKGQYRPEKILGWTMAAIAFLYSLMVAVMPFFDRIKYVLLENITIEDPFALAGINADAGWRGFEGLPAIILLAGIVMLLAGFYKSEFLNGLMAVFLCFCLFTYGCVLLITPRIERYSQHAAVEFFKSVSHEDAYLETLGYKSYAHLFYGKARPVINPGEVTKEWLLEGDIDKNVYIAMKTDKKHKYLERYPELKVIYEKNGFVFCVRYIR